MIGIALDLDGGNLEFYKNNVSQGIAATGITGTWYAYTAGLWVTTSTTSITANFGSSALTYTPPAGYNAGLYS